MKTRFTIQETADLIGISRSSLYKKYFSTGKLSRQRDDTDKVYIDASELARVFPDADVTGEKKNWKSFKDVPKMSEDDSLFQKRIDILEEKNRLLLTEKERLVAHLIRQVESQNETIAKLEGLLEHKPPGKEKPLQKPREGLLKRLAKAVLDE